MKEGCLELSSNVSKVCIRVGLGGGQGVFKECLEREIDISAMVEEEGNFLGGGMNRGVEGHHDEWGVDIPVLGVGDGVLADDVGGGAVGAFDYASKFRVAGGTHTELGLEDTGNVLAYT